MERYSYKQKKKIRLLMKRALNKYQEVGWTYRQVAPILKVSVSTVWRWFHYKSLPSQRHIIQIKKFFGYVSAR